MSASAVADAFVNRTCAMLFLLSWMTFGTILWPKLQTDVFGGIGVYGSYDILLVPLW